MSVYPCLFSGIPCCRRTFSVSRVVRSCGGTPTLYFSLSDTNAVTGWLGTLSGSLGTWDDLELLVNSDYGSEGNAGMRDGGLMVEHSAHEYTLC